MHQDVKKLLTGIALENATVWDFNRVAKDYDSLISLLESQGNVLGEFNIIGDFGAGAYTLAKRQENYRIFLRILRRENGYVVIFQK